MPEPQNYGNHKRYVAGYHVVTALLILALLVWSIKELVVAPSLASATGVVASLALIMIFYYARAFALQAQNRLIRLEEQLRMMALLPDELKNRIGDLRPGNFVALRFASDAELPGLVRRVLSGELTTQDSIKQAIKDWRPDNLRV